MYNIYEIIIDDHLPINKMVYQENKIKLATNTLLELERTSESIALRDKKNSNDILWANVNITCPNAHLVKVLPKNRLAISISYQALEKLMSAFNDFLPTDINVIDTLY